MATATSKKNLTAKQIEMLDKQREAIDGTFSEIAGILKQKGLDRHVKKYLTKVIVKLDQVSDMVAKLTTDEDEEIDGAGDAETETEDPETV